MIRKVKHIFFYLLLLVPSYIFFALAWNQWVDGTMYYCSDKAPFLSFMPPFNHGALAGDYWIASKNDVYSTWYVFLVGMFSVPVMILAISAKHKKAILQVFAGVCIALTFIFIEAFSLTTSSPSEPSPPLDNMKAQYRIVKLRENFALLYSASFNTGIEEEALIYVGNSKVDLTEYVGFQVRISGDYSRYENGLCKDTNRQCIAGQCHDIFEERSDEKVSPCAVDIELVERIETK